jgi:hypothetical protein
MSSGATHGTEVRTFPANGVFLVATNLILIDHIRLREHKPQYLQSSRAERLQS